MGVDDCGDQTHGQKTQRLSSARLSHHQNCSINHDSAATPPRIGDSASHCSVRVAAAAAVEAIGRAIWGRREKGKRLEREDEKGLKYKVRRC